MLEYGKDDGLASGARRFVRASRSSAKGPRAATANRRCLVIGSLGRHRWNFQKHHIARGMLLHPRLDVCMAEEVPAQETASRRIASIPKILFGSLGILAG